MVGENKEEIFPIVDLQGHVVGKASRGACHDGSMLLHPVVHLHLFNSRGELYLQKRPAWKEIQPGRWDTAVGGHVDYGESVEQALVREVREELGIEGFLPRLLRIYPFRSEREYELIHLFSATYDGPLFPGDELDGGSFWSPSAVLEQIGRGIFTPNFESEARWLFEEKGMM